MNRIDPQTEAAVRRFLALIADRFDIAGAIVYGSRARGTHRPESDADVAVLLKGERQRFLKTALAMSDVAFDALLETGINNSPLPVWLDEWEHPENYTNPALLQNIARRVSDCEHSIHAYSFDREIQARLRVCAGSARCRGYGRCVQSRLLRHV